MLTLQEALAKVKTANVKEPAVVNVEEIEMGIRAAQELGLTGNVSHYNFLKKKREFDAFGYPEITIPEAFRMLTGYKKWWRADEESSWTSYKSVGRCEYAGSTKYALAAFDARMTGAVYHRSSKVARLSHVSNLIVPVPPSILGRMKELQDTGRVSGFCAMGFPEAFREPKADPIIMAVVASGSSSLNLVTSQVALYFIGKYE